MIYTITLNPAIDCFTDAGTVVPGRVNRARSQQIRFGGKGINVSYALREFGAPSVLMGFSAGFVGDALVTGLESEGFICDFVRLKSGNTRINIKLTSDSDGDPDTEINAAGPIPDENDIQSLTDKLTRLGDGDVLVLAGSLPAGTDTEIIEKIAGALPHGVNLACDMSGDALRCCLGHSPEFVKPNVHELCELFGIDTCESEVEKYAEKLVQLGAKNVLVTMGDAGAYYTSADGVSGYVHSPEKPEKARKKPTAVGCGDSAVAGWLIGMGFAGDASRHTALSASSIDADDPLAAAKLAVAFGSASFYFGFPPTPEAIGYFDGGLL